MEQLCRSDPLRAAVDAAGGLRQAVPGPFRSCARLLSRLRATSLGCAAQPSATARPSASRLRDSAKRTRLWRVCSPEIHRAKERRKEEGRREK